MKMMLRIALFPLLVADVPVAAQQPQGCVPLDVHGTLPLHCADRRPQPDSAATVLLRRVLLRTAGTWTGFEGSFRIAFTVDTLGRIVRPTLQVLDLDPSQFAQRLPPLISRELRYLPALRAGVPVAVAFEQRFEYRHPGDRGGDISVAPLLMQVRESTDPRGSTVRLDWVPVADAPLPGLGADSSRARQMDALAAVLADSSWEAAATACVSLRSGDGAARADAGEIVRLRAVRQRVAAPGECPQTYGTGWVEWNEDGTERVRPPGAEPDPYIVTVTDVVPWTEDWVVVGLRVRRSAGRLTFRCVQHRAKGGRWSTRCERTSASVF